MTVMTRSVQTEQKIEHSYCMYLCNLILTLVSRVVYMVYLSRSLVSTLQHLCVGCRVCVVCRFWLYLAVGTGRARGPQRTTRRAQV